MEWLTSNFLFTVYTTIYVMVVLAILVVVAVYLIPVYAVARMFFTGERGLTEQFVVDPEKPEVPKRGGQLGVIRDVRPLELVIVTRRGGEWAFPVMQKSGHRYVVRGLAEGPTGMQRNCERDWDILKLKPRDDTGAVLAFPQLIQKDVESWRILYLYRKWVERYLNGMQVVRMYFPLLLSGRVMYEPVTHRFVRARPKGSAFRKDTMEYLDRAVGDAPTVNLASVEMVVDTSDHVLLVFPLSFLSETFPVGKSAYSFRAHVTLSLEVMNVLRLLSYPDWSAQLLAGVNNACGTYFRTGTLESVYALEEGTEGDELQELIRRHVTDSEIKKMGKGRYLEIRDGVLTEEEQRDWGICQALGLYLHSVTLNDLVPADSNTEKAVTELMSGVMKGEIAARVAGMLTREQLEAIKDATPEQLDAMARQTAASQLTAAKHVDWFNMPSGSGAASSMQAALLAALIRTLKNTQT